MKAVLYPSLVLQAQSGAKNFRQEAAKRCKAEVMNQWTGDNKLYDHVGVFHAEVGKQMLNSKYALLLKAFPQQSAH